LLNPKLSPQPPQKSNSKIIQIQLSLPHPLPHPPNPLLPQQESNRIIQIKEQQLFPSLHPHPQPVAAKSLIFKSSKIYLTLHNMEEVKMCD
jgi:hypothetical protein